MPSLPIGNELPEHTTSDVRTLHKASWMVTVTLGYKIIELAVTSLFRNRKLGLIMQVEDIRNCSQLLDYLALLHNYGLLKSETIDDICTLSDARELIQTHREQTLVTQNTVKDYSNIVGRVIDDIEKCCADIDKFEEVTIKIENSLL